MNNKLEQFKKLLEDKKGNNSSNNTVSDLAAMFLSKSISELEKIKGDQGDPGYTPLKGKDYFTEKEINTMVEYVQSKVKDGEKGEKGDQGIPGKNGETPLRGIDYWTEKDQARILRDVLSQIPKPKDGVTPSVDDLVKKVKDSTPPINFKDEIGKILSTPGFRMLLHGGGGSSGGTTSPLTTKGDLYAYSTTNDRLPVGTNGQILSADSTQATGLKWIANSGGSTAVSYAETPSGTINSSNVTFTLANTPANSNGVIILLDGVTQYNGIDYTVSGTTITFTTAPVTGSSIFAYYNIVSGGNGATVFSLGRAGSNQGLSTGTYYFDTSLQNTSVFSGVAPELTSGNIMPFSGTLKNLYIDMFNNGSSGSSVFTIMKNGVAQTLTLTVAAGVTSITGDTTHTVTIAAGDRITLRTVLTGTGSILFGFSYTLI